MRDFLHDHLYLMVISFALLGAGSVLLVRWRKRRREWKEMSQYKQRNEKLAQALRNPLVEQECARPEGPMEITWGEKNSGKSQNRKGSPMVELVALSAYSNRKYVYRLDQPIRIGSGTDNQMELHWEGVRPQHCELFLNEGRPCARSLSEATTWVKRGKNQAEVGPEGVYLKNGDRIRIGAAEIQFRQFKG